MFSKLFQAPIETEFSYFSTKALSRDTLEKFSKREEKVWNSNMIKYPVEPQISNVVYTHKFLDNRDAQSVLGPKYKSILNNFGLYSNEAPFGQVDVVFRGEPDNIGFENIIDSLNGFNGRLTWIMFHEYKTNKTRIYYAKIVNSIELGSKHLTIAKKINKDFNNVTFISAGEIEYKGDDLYEYNFNSGSFIAGRLEQFHRFNVDPSDNNTNYKITNSETLVGDIFRELNPGFNFVYTKTPFVEKIKYRFQDLLLESMDFYEYAFIHPDMTYGSFKLCYDIIRTSDEYYKNKDYDFSVWTDRHRTITLNARMDDDPSVNDNLEIYLEPHMNDIVKAYKNLRYAGFTQFGLEGQAFIDESAEHFTKKRPETDKKAYDFNRVPFYFWIKPSLSIEFVDEKSRRHNLTFTRLLGKSNSEIFHAVLDNKKKCVAKILSVYPFAESHIFLAKEGKLGLREREFYVDAASDIYSFHVIGSGFFVLTLPYLGKSITHLPIFERLKLYNKFKQDFAKQFIKTIKIDNGSFSLAYTDVKPDNICYDGKKFNLIDPDSIVVTRQWYGTTIFSMPTLRDLMFAVYSTHYWFITGFDFKGMSNVQKYNWVESLEAGPKGIFEKLLLTDDEKQIYDDYIEFSKVKIDLSLKTFGKLNKNNI